MMKKLFLTVLIAVMFLVSGCSIESEQNRNETSFPVLPEQIAEVRTLYCDEILNRTNSTVTFFSNAELQNIEMIEKSNSQDFFSELEIATFENWGYTILSEKGLIEHDGAIYYYPIIFQDTEKLIMLCNYNGRFQKRNLNPEEFYPIYEPLDYEFIHLPNSVSNNSEIIEINEEYALIYNKPDAKLEKWSFGKLATSYILENGATFEGKSELEGYVFQHNNTVYVLTYDGKLNQVATNIAEVLTCNFRISDKYYSQPVFLLTNGRKNALVENTLQKF